LQYGEAKISDTELTIIWTSILDEYMTVFGISKGMMDYVMHTKKLISLEIDYAITKKESLKMRIKFEKTRYKELNPVKEEQSNYMEIITAVESARGGQAIDESTTTVRKFYTYLKQIENGESVKR